MSNDIENLIKFQSLIGIIEDFDSTRVSAITRQPLVSIPDRDYRGFRPLYFYYAALIRDMFQSLIGIIEDFDEGILPNVSPKVVSIPDRDYRGFRLPTHAPITGCLIMFQSLIGIIEDFDKS